MGKNKKLKISFEQWELPVSIDSNEHFVSMRDMCEGKVSASLFEELSLSKQAKIVSERIQQQPKFEILMVGAGIVTKENAIAEVLAQSSVGKTLIEIEQKMIARMMKKAKLIYSHD